MYVTEISRLGNPLTILMRSLILSLLDFRSQNNRTPEDNITATMTTHSNKIRHFTQEDTILSEALSAALGGAFSSVCLYPLEVVKTKMMHEECNDGLRQRREDDQKNVGNDEDGEQKNTRKTVEETIDKERHGTAKSSISMISFAHRLYQRQGGSAFFAGWEVSAVQSAIEKALYFVAFTGFKSLYRRLISSSSLSSSSSSSSPFDSRSQRLSTVATLLLGCLAEWAHLPVSLPIDAVTTVIQTMENRSHFKNKVLIEESDGSESARNDVGKDGHRAMAILLTILRNKTMYKGIEAHFLLCLRPAIQYTMFEKLKDFIIRKRQGRLEKNSRSGSKPQTSTSIGSVSSSVSSLSAIEAFALGMIARSVATLVIFPFQRAKVRIQSTACRHEFESSQNDDAEFGDRSDVLSSVIEPTTSIWKMIEQTYNKQGIGGLFQGLGPEITRGMLSAAIMLMVKERVSVSVKSVLYRNSRAPEQNSL